MRKIVGGKRAGGGGRIGAGPILFGLRFVMYTYNLHNARVERLELLNADRQPS